MKSICIDELKIGLDHWQIKSLMKMYKSELKYMEKNNESEIFFITWVTGGDYILYRDGSLRLLE